LVYSAAIMSSNMMPVEPAIFSILLAGHGFMISNILNRKNPSITEKMPNGTKYNDRSMPHASSITIMRASFRL